MGLDAQEVADWDAALSAAQHHADLMPVRERDTHHPTLSHSHSHSHSQGDPMSAGQEGVAEGGGGGGGGGAGSSPGHEPGRAMYNGTLLARKKLGRKNKMKLLGTPEAKRARALDSMVSAAERSNALQKGAAEAGAEHLRRLELADAEVREGWREGGRGASVGTVWCVLCSVCAFLCSVSAVLCSVCVFLCSVSAVLCSVCAFLYFVLRSVRAMLCFVLC